MFRAKVWTKSPNYGKTKARVRLEELLGRPLLENEVAHHKDGDCSNDADENLEVLQRGYHNVVGGNTAKWLKAGRESKKIKPPTPNKAWCSKCKQFKDKSEFSFCSRHWNNCSFWCRDCDSKHARERRRRRHES